VDGNDFDQFRNYIGYIEQKMNVLNSCMEFSGGLLGRILNMGIQKEMSQKILLSERSSLSKNTILECLTRMDIKDNF
jgi:ABC-type phosphate/phosphonate transport system ATPase subunit